MANMSYCRFQNTYADVKDCAEALGAASDEGLDLKQFLTGLGSDDERRAVARFIRNCRSAIEAYESLGGEER